MLTTAARRPKESFSPDLELAPVRLIGGFVCVDTHLGCAGCQFCLNRRYPGPREVLERRLHRDWSDAGWPPARIAALVAGLPAVARAGVPVRFGHLSDLRYEVDGAEALLDALPPAHPVMLLTRFPVASRVATLLAAHPNALITVSITPPVQGALETDVDPRAVLSSLSAVPPAQLFVMLGPLVEASRPGVSALLPSLPPGAAVGFKPLAPDGLPFDLAAVPARRDTLDALAAEARALGLDAPPMAGCRLRTNLGVPFFRHRALLAEDPRRCDRCRNRAVCAAVPPPADDALREEAARLGLSLGAVRRTESAVTAEVSVPVARADETFLSEALRWPVFLTGIERGNGFRAVEVSGAVVRRWERAGVLPVDALAAATAEMMRRCGIGRATGGALGEERCSSR